MINTRLNDGIITGASLDKVNEFLTGELKEFEICMEQKYKKKKKNNLNLLGIQYKLHLHQTVSKLQDLSRQCLNEVVIEHIKPIKRENKIDDDYRHYSNVMQNLSDMVQREIVTQQSPTQALICMERWIYILKLSYEQHDYFTAGSIIFGLNSASIIKLHLENKLSSSSKSILEYYTKIYNKQYIIHSQHERQFNNGKTIIPMLTALPNLLENISNSSDDEHVIDTSKIYINLYEAIQKDNVISAKRSNGNITTQLNSLQLDQNEKLPDEHCINAEVLSRQHKKSKLKIKSDKFVKRINLYDADDLFYQYFNELSHRKDELSNLKDGKFNGYNLNVLVNIEKILKDVTINFKGKINKINTLLSGNEKLIKKHLFSKYQAIIKTLDALHALENKYLLLEPKPKKKIILENRINSESKIELELKRAVPEGESNEKEKKVVDRTLTHHKQSSHQPHTSKSRHSLNKSSHPISPPLSSSLNTANASRSIPNKSITQSTSSEERLHSPFLKNSSTGTLPSPHSTVSSVIKQDICNHSTTISSCSMHPFNSSENTLSSSHKTSLGRKLPRKYKRDSSLSALESHSSDFLRDSLSPRHSTSSSSLEINTHVQSVINSIDQDNQGKNYSFNGSTSWVLSQVEKIDQPKKSHSALLPTTNKEPVELTLLHDNVKNHAQLINNGLFIQDTNKQESDSQANNEVQELLLDKHVSNSKIALKLFDQKPETKKPNDHTSQVETLVPPRNNSRVLELAKIFDEQELNSKAPHSQFFKSSQVNRNVSQNQHSNHKAVYKKL